MATNRNIYSIFLFETSEISLHPKPICVMEMSSSSNRPAIEELKWLSDNYTLAFLGTQQDAPFQVYTLDVRTRSLVQRTKHPTSISHFDISGDGLNILFTAQTPTSSAFSMSDQQRRDGIVVKNQPLTDLLSGHFDTDSETDAIFQEATEERQVSVPDSHIVNENSQILMSPNGRYGIVTAYFRKANGSWSGYNNHRLNLAASRPSSMGNDDVVYQFFLLDCAEGVMKPLLDAPALYTAQYIWAADGRSLWLKTFLPLEGQSANERAERAKKELPSRVNIPDGNLFRVSEEEWRRAQPVARHDQPIIMLKEDPNTPPKIVALDPNKHTKTILLDLNPQFSNLNLGNVETFSFLVHGIRMQAGLYLPPGYQKAKRYPLLIQTHGYDSERFSMDGCEEWSSGFAARPLAAAGIIVAQAQRFVDGRDYDRVGADRTLGKTVEQSFRTFMSLVYVTLIDDLDKAEMVDSHNVGISGFSRTVWFVAYTLTHSDKRFRAVLLTDGIDGGYFRYIANRDTEFETDNGGLAPFGKVGLGLWMEQSPGFNLDRISAPVRLLCMKNPISQWEFFIGLQLQNKPVELIEIPDGDHLLQKPFDRKIAMQGMVDWFRFWLQNYRDPIPNKAAEYERWQQMVIQTKAEAGAR